MLTRILGVAACLAVLGWVGLAASPPSRAEGISEAQAAAILKELRQINATLERIEKQRVPQPAAPSAARVEPAKAAKVSSADRPVLGDAAAPVTVVEFTDYQCPYCARFHRDTLPLLKREFIDTGRVRLVVKDLPLSFHAHARKAAQAAHCAGDQHAFWLMHDKLFENAGQLRQNRLPDYAAELGLDAEAFRTCLAGDRHLAAIDTDIDQAGAAGIRGTPSFVIGRSSADVIDGVGIRGAQPYAVFKQRIEALLPKAGGRAPTQ